MKTVYFALVTICLLFINVSTEENSSTTPDWFDTKTTSSSVPGKLDEPNTSGIDSSDAGDASSLADLIADKIGSMLSGGTSENGTTTTTNSSESQEQVESNQSTKQQQNVSQPLEQNNGGGASNENVDLNDCKTKSDLVLYSKDEVISEDIMEYFKYNLTVSNIEKELFDSHVSEELKNCLAGQWCLGDEHTKLKESYEKFQEIVCKKSWLEDLLYYMSDARFECSDSEKIEKLMFTIELLCEAAYDSRICYARTYEVVYLTRLGLVVEENQDYCQGSRASLTREYLCADKVCDLDARLLLENYIPLESMINTIDAGSFHLYCNDSDTCQYDEVDGIKPQEKGYATEGYEDIEELLDDILLGSNDDEEWNDEKKPSTPDSDNIADDNEINQQHQEDGQKGDNVQEIEDSSQELGIVLLTAVAVFTFGMLLFVGYRRFRQKRAATYRRGYSQLTEEEARMLKSEYD